MYVRNIQKRNQRKEDRLLREEEKLRESTIRVGISFLVNQKVQKEAARLWTKKRKPDKEELMQLLFHTYARKYIQPDLLDDPIKLRTIWEKGSYLLYRGDSLKSLSEEQGLEWKECLDYYRQASEQIADQWYTEFIQSDK